MADRIKYDCTNSLKLEVAAQAAVGGWIPFQIKMCIEQFKI
jgi:hypothetical protein